MCLQRNSETSDSITCFSFTKASRIVRANACRGTRIASAQKLMARLDRVRFNLHIHSCAWTKGASYERMARDGP